MVKCERCGGASGEENIGEARAELIMVVACEITLLAHAGCSHGELFFHVEKSVHACSLTFEVVRERTNISNRDRTLQRSPHKRSTHLNVRSHFSSIYMFAVNLRKVIAQWTNRARFHVPRPSRLCGALWRWLAAILEKYAGFMCHAFQNIMTKSFGDLVEKRNQLPGASGWTASIITHTAMCHCSRTYTSSATMQSTS